LQAALHLERVQSRSTGKERDTESGNDYFGARYYGSSMGRFMSPDTQDPSDALPFVGIDPIPYADPANPQSFNLYSYVRNNPLTNTDPDGHDVNICDNNGNCHQVTNEQYQAAQQGNNGGLNVPTLDQVGSNGNGSGQFNSTAITDSSGSTVGTATYVSNGNLDYYANANGYQQLATASRATNQVTAVYAGVYGTLIAGAVAAGPVADLIAAQRYRAALAAWKALSAATGAAGLINKFFKTGEVPPGLTPEMMSAYLNLAKTYISAGLGTGGWPQSRCPLPTHDEGAPGPSHLGTGDDSPTMRRVAFVKVVVKPPKFSRQLKAQQNKPL
jgi:RHS repeat-associated protein